MSTLITILFVLTALLLIGIILLQQPKTTGGLFAGTGQSLLGTSGKPFWTKFTTVVAAVFMALCLLMNFFPRSKDAGTMADRLERQQQAESQPAEPAAQPGAAPEAPAPAKAPAVPEKAPAPVSGSN